MTTFEKEIGIIEGTLDLEMARLNRDYKYGLGMAVATDTVLEYCFTESESEEKGILSRMIDAIASFIHKINEAVVNLFSKDDHVELDDFLKSQTGQVQLSYDMESIDREVNKKVLEGRKLIQAISSATGISDEKVAKFADGGANVVNKYGGFVVTTAAIGGLRAFVAHKSFNDLDKKVSDWRHVMTEDEANKMTAAQVAKEQNDRKIAKNKAKAAKRQKQKQTVLNGMNKMFQQAGNAKTKVAGEINKVYQDAKAEAGKKTQAFAANASKAAKDTAQNANNAAKNFFDKHKK